MTDVPDTPVVLDVRDLRLLRGTREILAGVDLTVGDREVVALMGLSGAGKTTVLRAIAGLEGADAGTVTIYDRRTAEAPDRQSARRPVGMVFQFHHLFEHLSAIDNICLAPVRVLHVPRAQAEQRAIDLMSELGVLHRRDARPRELSGGEAQRVALARALAMDPPLLLLDEPTASLDPARRDELASSLRALAATGRALLLTSHDDHFVRAAANRVVILADGRVVETGDPQAVFAAPRHEATRRLLSNAIQT
jgi:ABC-type polar amino acid transport system ATPase subunit